MSQLNSDNCFEHTPNKKTRNQHSSFSKTSYADQQSQKSRILATGLLQKRANIFLPEPAEAFKNFQLVGTNKRVQVLPRLQGKNPKTAVQSGENTRNARQSLFTNTDINETMIRKCVFRFLTNKFSNLMVLKKILSIRKNEVLLLLLIFFSYYVFLLYFVRQCIIKLRRRSIRCANRYDLINLSKQRYYNKGKTDFKPRKSLILRKRLSAIESKSLLRIRC